MSYPSGSLEGGSTLSSSSECCWPHLGLAGLLTSCFAAVGWLLDGKQTDLPRQQRDNAVCPCPAIPSCVCRLRAHPALGRGGWLSGSSPCWGSTDGVMERDRGCTSGGVAMQVGAVREVICWAEAAAKGVNAACNEETE